VRRFVVGVPETLAHPQMNAFEIARQIIRGAGSAADNERLLAEAYAGMRAS
jgi:hypothetical protein